MSGHQTLVPTEHKRPPSGLHLSLSGSSPTLCLVCATLGHIRHTLLNPDLSRLWETLLGTQEPSAAPGSCVRLHQAHLPRRAHQMTSASTPGPVTAQGGPGSSHLLGCPRGPRPLHAWIPRPNGEIYPLLSLPVSLLPPQLM